MDMHKHVCIPETFPLFQLAVNRTQASSFPLHCRTSAVLPFPQSSSAWVDSTHSKDQTVQCSDVILLQRPSAKLNTCYRCACELCARKKPGGSWLHPDRKRKESGVFFVLFFGRQCDCLLSFKITGGGLCHVSYLMLCWWVYKTSTISFSLQLIKLYASTYSEGGKNQKPSQLAPKHFMNTFLKVWTLSVIKDNGCFQTCLVISSCLRLCSHHMAI